MSTVQTRKYTSSRIVRVATARWLSNSTPAKIRNSTSSLCSSLSGILKCVIPRFSVFHHILIFYLRHAHFCEISYWPILSSEKVKVLFHLLKIKLDILRKLGKTISNSCKIVTIFHAWLTVKKKRQSLRASKLGMKRDSNPESQISI